MKNSNFQRGFAPIALIIIVVILLAGGGYWFYHKSNLNNQTYGTLTPSVSVTPNATVSLKLYTNSQYGFNFSYRGDLALYEQKDKDEIPTLGYIPPCDPDLMVVCVAIPAVNYPNTNFEGAGLSVNLIKDAADKAACRAAISDAGVLDGDITSVTINGTSYDYAQVSQGAAGHQSNDQIYHTFHNGSCLELDLRVGTGTFENYPEGSIKLFTDQNREAIFETLSRIVSTFKFSR